MKGLEAIKNDIKRFWYIPPNIERIYEKEAVQNNSFTIKILAMLMIVIELFNICRVLFLSNSGLATVNNRIYFTMYVTLLLSAIIFCLLEWRLKERKKARARLYIATAYVWMMWHVALNCYDLIRNRNGDITTFSCAVLVLAIFAQIKPKHTLRVAILAYFTLLLCSGAALDTGGYINATISLILACLVALRLHALAIIQIYQHIEIAEKSKQILDERAELKSSLEKYETILNNTNDHIFEIDFRAERLVFAKNSRFAQRFEQEVANVTEWLKRQIIIYPDDTEKLIQAMHDLSTTKQEGDYTFRMHSRSGDDRWYRLRVFVNHNEDDAVRNGIGIISDIDIQQRQVETLTSKIKTDPMTGLLNAAAFRSDYDSTRGTLEENDHLVMFMIDLDNFKTINDTYGHYAGDCVLKAVANVLDSMFRNSDSAARLGGDEFAVLMKNVKDSNIIKIRAEQLAHEMSKIEVTEHKIKVSCSVGIAVINRNDIGYDDIYQCADKALYAAKGSGKGQYKIIY